MNKIYLIIATLIFTLSANAQTEEEMLNALSETYYKHLSSEGYMPSIMEDGDVKFKKEGKTFYITPYDDYTFEISRYVEVEEGQDCSEMYSLINAFHFERKQERALVYEGCDFIQIQSNSILSNKSDWKGILEQSMLWLDYAVEKFFELHSSK